MSKVICINDKGRNESIPSSHWVKEGQEYTPIAEYTDMNGVGYYVLQEIDLSSLGTLYKGFNKNRFAPKEDTTNKVKQYKTMEV